mmetsp:Transcript_35164/g.76992  ORF Transcript_35164/g.76992 Transcript_35164/m.76992 type:complete len:300 (+) Transcript_35164:174-1073(+)|eukprot:CAMPEP_0178489438 /NCGR_PEP_ID=MMETSP0696-20121128/10376_1 /TAXON_ID=265572 /ORGANISM="Extubocellulus spinifer, Strain CCMP396" /LENGTH=299 /DNA_ID=CAMNT_0020117239 /DNA_START=113 /DNA_END=1012 /DNA_ORIENTATION=+
MSASRHTPTKILLTEHHSLLESIASEVATVTSIDPTTLTPSDTLLIVDVQHDFLPGGAFGVAEGDEILPGICSLIGKFREAGGTVIATRDYHPRNHCSFTTHGGPFPPHCIQGSRGSFLHDELAATLQPLLADEVQQTAKKNVHVVYKAFSPDIDSFGAFEYTESESEGRLSTRTEPKAECHCSLNWTGGFVLYSSMQCEDVNAPPDVMSVLSKKALADVVPKGGRMFVCGLAMDYCVIDSAVNYVTSTDGGKGSTYIVHELTRAAHIPGVGGHGSGFLTDPKHLIDKMKDNGIGLVNF